MQTVKRHTCIRCGAKRKTSHMTLVGSSVFGQHYVCADSALDLNLFSGKNEACPIRRGSIVHRLKKDFADLFTLLTSPAVGASYLVGDVFVEHQSDDFSAFLEDLLLDPAEVWLMRANTGLWVDFNRFSDDSVPDDILIEVLSETLGYWLSVEGRELGKDADIIVPHQITDKP